MGVGSRGGDGSAGEESKGLPGIVYAASGFLLILPSKLRLCSSRQDVMKAD